MGAVVRGPSRARIWQGQEIGTPWKGFDLGAYVTISHPKIFQIF